MQAQPRAITSNGQQYVRWEHRDTSKASHRTTDSAGVAFQRAETDPSGMDAGLAAPPQLTHQQHKREDTTYPSFGDAVGSGGTECRVDGVVSPCSMAMQLVNSGAAALCPDGDCGVHSLTAQAVGANGSVLDSSTVLRSPGQLGRDGSLDGTYQDAVSVPRAAGESSSRIRPPPVRRERSQASPLTGWLKVTHT